MMAPSTEDGHDGGIRADVDEGALVKVLAGFWTGLVVLFVLRTITESWSSKFASLGRRLPEAVLGAALCWLMYRILRRVNPSGTTGGLLWLVCLSLPFGCIFSIANAWAIYASSSLTPERCGDGAPCTLEFLRNLAVEYSVNFAFVFLAWGALYLGMRATAQALAAERQASASRDAARLAELRALRYQVNPHFLFNALNSIGTLVDRGDRAAAHGMISEMSSFLRYGLAIDPLADVALDDEVEMQRRYLKIEHVRFAHRLSVVIDIEPSVSHAQIPSLLLQPLVENAVRHGVASTSAPVTVTVRAAPAAGGSVAIVVEDDAPRSPSQPAEHPGIGLRNVTERLRARFGSDASLTVGRRSGGGFRAEILMPLVVL